MSCACQELQGLNRTLSDLRLRLGKIPVLLDESEPTLQSHVIAAVLTHQAVLLRLIDSVEFLGGKVKDMK